MHFFWLNLCWTKPFSVSYKLKAVGANKDAAEFAGINVKKYMTLSMFISGALAGLAAAVHITGVSPNTITMLGGFQNFGFNGIPVALLSNASVVPNIFSALLFGGMNYGSGYIQSVYGRSYYFLCGIASSVYYGG